MHLDSLPNEKERKKYIRQVEKKLKKEYTPRMKKLTFSQGKLLIKLVDRECEQTSYQLVKSFMGSFKRTVEEVPEIQIKINTRIFNT